MKDKRMIRSRSRGRRIGTAVRWARLERCEAPSVQAPSVQRSSKHQASKTRKRRAQSDAPNHRGLWIRSNRPKRCSPMFAFKGSGCRKVPTGISRNFAVFRPSGRMGRPKITKVGLARSRLLGPRGLFATSQVVQIPCGSSPVISFKFRDAEPFKCGVRNSECGMGLERVAWRGTEGTTRPKDGGVSPLQKPVAPEKYLPEGAFGPKFSGLLPRIPNKS
jgi:hypothetical protein